MSNSRSCACLASVMLFAFAPANSAEFECPSDSAQLPHESWAHTRIASTDGLYRRVHDGLWHGSQDPELQLAIGNSLTELLSREPGKARAYVELARFMMSYGALGDFILSEDAYDTVDQVLRTALALDPESASAWALEGLFRASRRGPAGRPGDGMSASEALAIADRYASLEPQVAFAWAQWHALNSEYENAANRLRQLLAAGNLSDAVTSAAYRRLANYYARLNQPANALRSAEDAVEAQRLNAINWLTLSTVALEQAGDSLRALESARTAYCIEESPLANRQIAYALYIGWAQDNVDNEAPTLDDERVAEAFERHPDIIDVMAYLSEQQGLPSLIQVFFAAGLSPDVSTSHGGPTLLYDAVRGGRLAEAERLVALGADVNRTGETYGSFLTEAVINQDEEMVRLLIENGSDVNARSLLAGTALIASVMGGDPGVVRLLLDAGADPNATNLNGETALQLAVLMWDDPVKRRSLVELLLDAGADPTVEIVPGLSLIDHVIEMDYTDVAALLDQASRVREEP